MPIVTPHIQLLLQHATFVNTKTSTLSLQDVFSLLKCRLQNIFWLFKKEISWRNITHILRRERQRSQAWPFEVRDRARASPPAR